MPGVRIIAMKNQLALLYSIRKEIGVGPLGPLFIIFLLFILGKTNLKNDVEFDFSIGHALFHFF